jgi:hypothetical protein
MAFTLATDRERRLCLILFIIV